MPMTIPQIEGLSTNALNRAFSNTVASYKFYWFLSLLDMHVKGNYDEMMAIDVASRMVAYAWYPIEYFKLSFGKADSMSTIIPKLAKITGITVDDKLEDKNNIIIQSIAENKRIKSDVKILLNNVPYRFLSPWIDTSSDNEMKRRSQLFENNCLYKLIGAGEKLTLIINPNWSQYLKANYEILRGFALWNLSLFLQSKNPNVPNIAGKIIRPENRESLKKQKDFWNYVIEIGGSLKCIYTNKKLQVNDYDLDHFIPWSFVSHNQNWNLIPADGSFNSFKSDRIPDLDYYLPKLAKMQHHALRIYVPNCPTKDSVLDEYYSLGVSPKDLMMMSEECFFDIYRNTFSPLCQMAVNMGFRLLKHE